jgi:hypothetical protein
MFDQRMEYYTIEAVLGTGHAACPSLGTTSLVYVRLEVV